jgi:hypothetical protein
MSSSVTPMMLTILVTSVSNPIVGMYLWYILHCYSVVNKGTNEHMVHRSKMMLIALGVAANFFVVCFSSVDVSRARLLVDEVDIRQQQQ